MWGGPPLWLCTQSLPGKQGRRRGGWKRDWWEVQARFLWAGGLLSVCVFILFFFQLFCNGHR